MVLLLDAQSVGMLDDVREVRLRSAIQPDRDTISVEGDSLKRPVMDDGLHAAVGIERAHVHEPVFVRTAELIEKLPPSFTLDLASGDRLVGPSGNPSLVHDPSRSNVRAF
ncbi:MAG TPA: hypothetical protein VHC69_21955 [Polyangiaceae bacterium]|nr:hypothetical protein [Polyangiaceae bacterium]